jgi:hypothetical protein
MIKWQTSPERAIALGAAILFIASLARQTGRGSTAAAAAGPLSASHDAKVVSVESEERGKVWPRGWAAATGERRPGFLGFELFSPPPLSRDPSSGRWTVASAPDRGVEDSPPAAAGANGAVDRIPLRVGAWFRVNQGWIVVIEDEDREGFSLVRPGERVGERDWHLWEFAEVPRLSPDTPAETWSGPGIRVVFADEARRVCLAVGADGPVAALADEPGNSPRRGAVIPVAEEIPEP